MLTHRVQLGRHIGHRGWRDLSVERAVGHTGDVPAHFDPGHFRRRHDRAETVERRGDVAVQVGLGAVSP